MVEPDGNSGFRLPTTQYIETMTGNLKIGFLFLQHVFVYLLNYTTSSYYYFNFALNSTQFSLELKPWSEISSGCCVGVGRGRVYPRGSTPDT